MRTCRIDGAGILALPPDSQEPDPSYRAALEWIWSFSKQPRSPDEIHHDRERKLDRMRVLLDLLGSPQRAYPSVLVAGTKGKGSTVALLAACLTAEAHRVGRYTSPHLVNWRERVCVDACPIGTEDVVSGVERLRAAIRRLPPSLGWPSTFDVGTALAFQHFADAHVDIAVVEVGVGGRDDATNVLEPLVSVVTPISRDHEQTLGTTLESIAWHKAGIMRPGRTVVLGPQGDEVGSILTKEADRVAANVKRVGRDWRWETQVGDPSLVTFTRAGETEPYARAHLLLMGLHQRDNATTAVAAAAALARAEPSLRVSSDGIRRGIEQVQWPGRLQVVASNPLFVVDGAHNEASAAAVARTLRDSFEFRRLHLVFGMSRGKDASGVLTHLAPLAAHVVLTQSKHERAENPVLLARVARGLAASVRVALQADPQAAFHSAVTRAEPDDLVLVTGSLFLVGEALVWARGREP